MTRHVPKILPLATALLCLLVFGSSKARADAQAEIDAAIEVEDWMNVSLEAASDSGSPRVRNFDAKTPEQARQWQEDCRLGLIEGLAVDEFLKKRNGGKTIDPLNVKVVAQEDRGQYTLYKITLDVMPGWNIPALLTVGKKGNGPFPAVVCVEAHKEHVYPEGKLNHWNELVKNRGWTEFGSILAKNGYITVAADFIVASPLAPDFKERRMLTHPGTPAYARNKSTHKRSNTTERIQIGIRLLDYLCSRKDVNSSKLGCVGLCKWAAAACHVAAVDSRIKGVVSSCALARDKKEVPWRFAGDEQPRFDLLDLYSLIAPRPILCQFGKADKYRPQYPTAAELEEMRRRYGILGGRPVDLEVFWHPGKHIVETSSLPGFFERAFRQSDGKGQKGTP